MSSRQQFLKGPGETGGDFDSDVQDSQGEVNDNYSHRLLNINKVQKGTLDKELISKKAKLNTNFTSDTDQMTNGLVIKKKKGLEFLNQQNKITGEESPRSDAQLVKRLTSIKTEGDQKQNQQQQSKHQHFNQKDGVTQKNNNDFQHDRNNKVRSFIDSEGTNENKHIKITENKSYFLQKSNTLKLQGGSDLNLQRHIVETNIDPNIIKNQEEEKEHDRYSNINNKPSQFKNNNKNIQFAEMQNQDGNGEEDKSNNSKGPHISDVASQKILNLLKSKKTVFSAAAEDEEIMDLELNLNEEPVTQGSVDQVVEISEMKEEFFIIHHAGIEVFGYIVDAFFICDIAFNFRTTFINDKTGLEVVRGRDIAMSYLLQWRFYFDLLSIIPFELLYTATNPNGNTNTTQFKIFDLLKLVRLLRLGRIITYLKFKQNIKIGFRIVQLLSMLLLIVHWVACIWFLIIDGTDWMPPRDANYGETHFYDDSMGRQYAILYYYGILLLLGSDILPMETIQTVYAALIVILGSIMTAFIFGNMAALMAAMNQKDSQFQDQFDAITNLMRAIKLPVKTQREVEAYLLHIQQVPDMQQDMKTFLKLLSPSLRSSILFHIYRSIIKQIPIFDNCSNIELRFIVNYMKTVIFLPQDEITRQGDKGTKIYFISRGRVEILIGPDETDVNEYELKRLNTNGSRRSHGNLGGGGGSLKSQTNAATPLATISIGVLGHQHNSANVSNLGGTNDNNSFQIIKKPTLGGKEPSEFQNSTLNDVQLSNTLQIPINANGGAFSARTNNKDENSTGAKSPRGSKNGSVKGGSAKGGKSSRSSEGLPHINHQKKIRDLGEGEYFGEIALITNLKRTATVKAKDFTTLGYMMQRNFIASKDEFPQIYQAFKQNIKLRYSDENFQFRQKMIRNVPYFSKMSETVIQELVYLLRPTRYDANMLVVKRGDSTDKIYFLKAGVVDVEVPLKDDKMHFDSLNAGSCFCIFSAFHDDRKQKFDFRTKTVCIVESIAARDIIALQKQYLELSDELKTLMVQIENNEKSEFDFFRYIPFRAETKKGRSEEWRANVRKKFRMAIARFFRRMKKARPVLTLLKLNKGNEQMNRQSLINHLFNKENLLSSDEENDERKHFKALHALDQLEKERKNKEQKLKMLKDRISNPSLFVISNLMNKQNSKKMSGTLNEEVIDAEYEGEPEVIIEADDHIDSGEEIDPGDVLLTLEVKPNTPYNQGDDTISVGKRKKNNSKDKDFDQTEDYIQLPLVTDEQQLENSQQKYPKIDGIRKELKRFRDEQLPYNTEEINEISVINNLSVMHQPGLVIENQHQDFTTLVGNFNSNNRPKVSSNTQQNTYNSTNQRNYISNYNQPFSTIFKNDLQINILEDNKSTPMALNSNKQMQNMFNNNHPNVINTESSNAFDKTTNNVPSWKLKLNMLKDQEFTMKVKNQPIGNQVNESQSPNKRKILSIKDKIQSSSTNVRLGLQNISETPITKTNNKLNSLSNRNPYVNGYISQQQHQQSSNILPETSRSQSNVRFAHHNNFNSISVSDNVSQMMDRVDTLGNYNNNYGSRKLETIKEENKQGEEDLIKVLTQINTSLQVQQQSMNTLQFDMLKRMMNLEKKLNRAMKIDIAANNMKNKPELSPNNRQFRIKKNNTHAEEIKSQLTGGGGISQKIRFKEPHSATNHVKHNSGSGPAVGSKQTSLVTSIKDESMNRIRFLDRDISQSDIKNNSGSKKSQQLRVIDSQTMSRQDSLGAQNRQLSTIMQVAKHPSGVSQGLQSPDSPSRKKGENLYSPIATVPENVNILSEQSDQMSQLQNKTANFLQVHTKLNNIANGSAMNNPDLMNSQYKYPNTPYFMTEINEGAMIDQNLQQSMMNRQQQILFTPPSRRSIVDSNNTEVKEQAFTGPSIGSNQVNNNGMNVQRNYAVSQYQRHKNNQKVQIQQLPQVQVQGSFVDNSMKKMMVEDSIDEDEIIDINNARGGDRNNLNQANLINSSSDQTLILDDQFFDNNPNSNNINQNYIETEKLPDFFTPEYLLVTANNKDGQQTSSQIIQPQIRNSSNNPQVTFNDIRRNQHQSPHHQQQISQQSQQQLTSGQQTPQVIYELRIDNLKLKENQQVNELNIIWLPNSIVQFQGTNANEIVEAAKKQQQEQLLTSSSRKETKHRKQSSKSTTRNMQNIKPTQLMNQYSTNNKNNMKQ